MQSSPLTMVEIIKKRLYFAEVGEGFQPPAPPSPAQDSRNSNTNLNPAAAAIYFTTDRTLCYTAFFADFGPLDIGLTYQFCEILKGHMTEAEARDVPVYYYVENHPHRRVNSAVLVMAYLIFILDYTAEDAYRPFASCSSFITFRDAAFCINTFPVTIIDCCRAMYRAKRLGHHDHNRFNLTSFQHLSKLQNGDFSWIVPGKFLAFSGPLSKRRELSGGEFSLLPHEYIPIMKSLNVTCIVRFNSKCYDRNVFTSAGIRHVDLYYEDGGNPSDNILQTFLSVCEGEKGAIAVHCKAGLGRTGTNIAAYMIKHYGYTARETIAWCRICRPGSIVGPQQQFMVNIEDRLVREGEAYRAKLGLRPLSGSASRDKERDRSAGGVGGAVVSRVGGGGGPLSPSSKEVSSILSKSMSRLSVSDQSAFATHKPGNNNSNNNSNNNNNSNSNNNSNINNNSNSNSESRATVCVTPPIDIDSGNRPTSKSSSFKPLMATTATTGGSAAAAVAMSHSVDLRQSSELLQSRAGHQASHSQTGGSRPSSSSQLNIDTYHNKCNQQQQQQQQQQQRSPSRPTTGTSQSGLSGGVAPGLSRQGSNRSMNSQSGLQQSPLGISRQASTSSTSSSFNGGGGGGGGGGSPIRYGGTSSIINTANNSNNGSSSSNQPYNYYSNFAGSGQLNSNNSNSNSNSNSNRDSSSSKLYGAAVTKR